MFADINKAFETHFRDNAPTGYEIMYSNVPVLTAKKSNFFRVEVLPSVRDYGVFGGDRIRGEVQLSLFTPANEGLLKVNEFVDSIALLTDGKTLVYTSGELQTRRGNIIFSGIDREKSSLYLTQLRWAYEANKVI